MPIKLTIPAGSSFDAGTESAVIAEVTPDDVGWIPDTVNWRITDGDAAVLQETKTAVNAYASSHYAFVMILFNKTGSVTLEVGYDADGDHAAASDSCSYRGEEVVLDNRLFLSPPFAEAVWDNKFDQANDALFMRLCVKLRKSDGSPLPNHVVYATFNPMVVKLFDANSPHAVANPIIDPSNYGYVLVSDSGGIAQLRVGCNEPTVGSFTVSAAGDTFPQYYAFLDSDPKAPALQAPTGPTNGLGIPENRPYFTAYLPPPGPDNAMRQYLGVFWLEGKSTDGLKPAMIGRIGDLADFGQDFPYYYLANDGSTKNKMGYVFQRGNNAQESKVLNFTATGAAMVVPDPRSDRHLDPPVVSPDIINMPVMEDNNAHVTLTVPKFPPDKGFENVNYDVKVIVYLNGWEEETGKPKRKILRLAQGEAKAPSQDKVITLNKDDLRHYAGQPAPGTSDGLLFAEYHVTNMETLLVRYSKILGMYDPRVYLDTAYKGARDK